MQLTDETPVLYDPEHGCVHDMIVDGRTAIYRHPVEEVLAKHPAFIQLPLGEAADRASAFARVRYKAGKAKPITVEHFHEMLDVLPPCRWTTVGGIEIFHVSERLCGSLVNWFIQDHNNGKCWEVVEDFTASRTSLLAVCTG